MFTLGAIMFAGTFAFAQQRTTDLEATLNLPTSGTIVYSGDTIHTQIAIANNGPDTLVAGDTILFKYLYTATEGGGSQSNVSLFTLTTSLAPGQTPLLINANIPFNNGSGYPVLHLNFCVHLFDPNTEPVFYSNNDKTPIKVSYNDPDTTNNTSCTSIVIENQETGIATIKQTSTSLQLFPNPAQDIVTIKLPEMQTGSLTVSVTDITGRKVLLQHYGAVQPTTQQLPLDVSCLPKGMYLITLKAGAKKRTGKLIIAR